MFERFTDRARRVVVLAQEEARLCGHDYISTGHLLLGALHEGEGIAYRSLTECGVTLEASRQLILGVSPAIAVPSGHVPFTPDAKHALELGSREALKLGVKHIGTEHILLGVLGIEHSVTVDVVLPGQGVTVAALRDMVLALLATYEAPPVQRTPPPSIDGIPASIEALAEPIDACAEILSELSPRHARSVLAYLTAWYAEATVDGHFENAVVAALKNATKRTGTFIR